MTISAPPALALPKVALHDHLDGGLRPATLLELARAAGLHLPANNAGDLARAVARRAAAGSLPAYLEVFGWTVPLMQSAAALTRIAREAVEDLAADGVVLAELRFAPLLHTGAGLRPQQAIDAVCAGLRAGSAATGMPAGLILCALRSHDEAEAVVRLFLDNQTPGSLVAGVDLAGPEDGFPVRAHPALRDLAAVLPGAPITIHAGEAAGVDSIWEAIEAGARRIGHGTRLVDDILGERDLVRTIVARGIHLEVCLSSNVQTGAVRHLEEHPLRRFLEEGVRLSLEADNRLVSATCHSREYSLAHRQLGIDWPTLARCADWALEASFLPGPVRRAAQQQIVARRAP